MSRAIDITGERYGRLVATSLSYRDKTSYWNFLCDCGNSVVVRVGNVRSGNTTSCGCFSDESRKERDHTRHGEWGNTFVERLERYAAKVPEK